eukprot:m.385438 g.385438  ORF g.385438 m.385438 type:complete len:222 (-) comp16738_c1_seq1:129-794(-)
MSNRFGTATVFVEGTGTHSGRASCVKCKKTIGGRAMRMQSQTYVGGPSRYGSGWKLGFHHLHCWKVQRSITKGNLVKGYSALSRDEKDKVDNRVAKAVATYASKAAKAAAAAADVQAAGGSTSGAPVSSRSKKKLPSTRQKMGIAKKKSASCSKVLARLNKDPAALQAMNIPELEDYVAALTVAEMKAALKTNGRRPPSTKSDVVVAFAAALKEPSWSWDD